MELTVGRIIHVIEPYNLHCQAGIISGIEDLDKGYISVHVFVPTLDTTRQVELRMGIIYSETHKPDTWHWPERA